LALIYDFENIFTILFKILCAIAFFQFVSKRKNTVLTHAELQIYRSNYYLSLNILRNVENDGNSS